MTDQDELDVTWPDPMAKATWRWKYSPDLAHDVVRCVRVASRSVFASPDFVISFLTGSQSLGLHIFPLRPP